MKQAELQQTLSNRIRKNLRRDKSAHRGSDCFRVYDRDIPGIPLAVDKYGEWLHCIHYETPHGRMDSLGQERIKALIEVAADACGIDRGHCVHKTRARRVKGETVKRLQRREETLTVNEGPLRFRVNLHDYLDTGLFLDHAILRKRLLKACAGKRVLNLFCYTGSLSSAASLGGATTVVSVDLSSRYLEWARANFALNGGSTRAQDVSFVEDDVFRFLRFDKRTFDLVIVDPPISSTSPTAPDFDIQVDFQRLMSAILPRCTSDAAIFFSTPLRSFTPPAQLDLQGRAMTNTTKRTTPAAFRHQPHQSFWIAKPGVSLL